jgi:hypothetical protein
MSTWVPEYLLVFFFLPWRLGMYSGLELRNKVFAYSNVHCSLSFSHFLSVTVLFQPGAKRLPPSIPAANEYKGHECLMVKLAVFPACLNLGPQQLAVYASEGQAFIYLGHGANALCITCLSLDVDTTADIILRLGPLARM